MSVRITNTTATTNPIFQKRMDEATGKGDWTGKLYHFDQGSPDVARDLFALHSNSDQAHLTALNNPQEQLAFFGDVAKAYDGALEAAKTGAPKTSTAVNEALERVKSDANPYVAKSDQMMIGELKKLGSIDQYRIGMHGAAIEHQIMPSGLIFIDYADGGDQQGFDIVVARRADDWREE